MKQRPILMSTPMVEAILENRKTETRRIIKGLRPGFRKAVEDYCKGIEVAAAELTADDIEMDALLDKCPYGQIGDQLWVKETFTWVEDTSYDDYSSNGGYLYKASCQGDPKEFKWKPSIFMPKEAARIWLQVKDISVERLTEIDDAGAINEGIEILESGRYRDYESHGTVSYESPRDSYFSLWDSINGMNSYLNNPWVWVIKFENIGFEKAAMLFTHSEKYRHGI